MTKDTRSPLKARPLRNPGQSVDQRRRELVLDKILQPALIAILFAAFAVTDFVRAQLGSPPSPWLWAASTAVAAAYAAWRIRQVLPELKALSQAADGEKAIGQFLERQRSEGYEVLHDVMGQGFNIDHVLIGPAGVFTIETKTWSKPASRDATIGFQDEKLVAGGFVPDRDPIIQVKGQATWLRNLLEESTGKRFAVHSVLLFPGWFVEPSAEKRPGIWVLEPKRLPWCLANSPIELVSADIKLASYHLSRYVREMERQQV